MSFPPCRAVESARDDSLSREVLHAPHPLFPQLHSSGLDPEPLHLRGRGRVARARLVRRDRRARRASRSSSTIPTRPDPAAPKRTWVHWVLYNLPPARDGLPEAVDQRSYPPAPAREQRLEAHRLRRAMPADRPPPLLPQALRARHRAPRPEDAEQGRSSRRRCKGTCSRGGAGRHLREEELGPRGAGHGRGAARGDARTAASGRTAAGARSPSLRWAAAFVITPKLVLPTVAVRAASGKPKFGWLKTLNASARNSTVAPPTRVRFRSDRSVL